MGGSDSLLGSLLKAISQREFVRFPSELDSCLLDNKTVLLKFFFSESIFSMITPYNFCNPISKMFGNFSLN